MCPPSFDCDVVFVNIAIAVFIVITIVIAVAVVIVIAINVAGASVYTFVLTYRSELVSNVDCISIRC